VEQITGTASLSNGNSPKTVTATCSPGKTALGGGYLVGGAASAIAVDQSYPSASDTWTVSGFETGGNPTWSLQAYVICA
jgi:hypothetical protein